VKFVGVGGWVVQVNGILIVPTHPAKEHNLGHDNVILRSGCTDDRASASI
jgi:hypothetical protein